MARTKWMVALLMFAFAQCVNAEVYKCRVNGKTTYSDTPCATGAASINVKPNSYSNDGINYQSLGSRNGSSNPRCSELMSEINNTVADPSSQSFGEMQATMHKRQSLREQYEMQCMTAEGRSAASQSRMERQLNDIQRQQRQMEVRQQEIQNKQREMEFKRRQEKILNGY